MKRAIVAVFSIGLLYLASMLWATGGRPSLPLDDSFIYFQYAREAARGNPLRVRGRGSANDRSDEPSVDGVPRPPGRSSVSTARR